MGSASERLMYVCWNGGWFWCVRAGGCMEVGWSRLCGVVGGGLSVAVKWNEKSNQKFRNRTLHKEGKAGGGAQFKEKRRDVWSTEG